MNVLVVNDGTEVARLLCEYFSEKAQQDTHLGVKVVDLQRTQTSFVCGTFSALPIREYRGDPGELAAAAGGAEGLVVHVAPVTREVMEAAPMLKFIACARGGPVNVDVKAAMERGIPVLYIPGRNANAVAELTIGLMILLARHVREAEEALRRDRSAAWSSTVKRPLVGIELDGKVLGIVGFGLVGRLVCRLALAFGMKVSAYDPYVEPAVIEAYGAKAAALEEVLETSDFLSLHLRESADTAGFMDRVKFSQMKRSAYFINTARGSLVDESALLEALDTGLIAGAALDVFAIEPLQSDSPLLRHKNVVLLPHIGGHTREVPLRSAEMLYEDILRLTQGEKPLRVLNAE